MKIYSTVYVNMLINDSFEEFTTKYQLEYLIRKLDQDQDSLSDWNGDDSPEGEIGRAHWELIIDCRKSHIKALTSAQRTY